MKGSGGYGSSSSLNHSQNQRGSQGDDHRGQRVQQGSHWGEPTQSSHSKSVLPPNSTYSSHHINSDNERLDPSDDELLDDEDEVYLRPGEPYGAWLLPVEDPYIRAVKVEEANRELFGSPTRQRRSNVKVRFWETRNEYYEHEEYDSPPSDHEVGSEKHTGQRNSVQKSSPRGSPPSPRTSPPK